MIRGVWQATVTRVEPGRVWIEIPRLTPGGEYGPCPVLQGVWTEQYRTEEETVATHPGVAPHAPHSHLVAPLADVLAAGDEVIVASVEGFADRWVVLGRLT